MLERRGRKEGSQLAGWPERTTDSLAVVSFLFLSLNFNFSSPTSNPLPSYSLCNTCEDFPPLASPLSLTLVLAWLESWAINFIVKDQFVIAILDYLASSFY